MKLPPDVQRLFYRYHADRLDTETYQSLIIETVLADGEMDDWRWLFQTYGKDAVRDWLSDPFHSCQLQPKVEWFWTFLLLDEPRETPRWSGGNGRRVVPPDALPDWWPDELR